MKMASQVQKNLTANIIKMKYPYLMLIPAFILVFIFNYMPLFGWIMAFVDYRPGISLLSAKFTGFKNFTSFLLANNDYLYLLRNTLSMNILSLLFNIIFAVAFAILLSEIYSKKFKRLTQTISFFPFFISWVTIYSLAYALFASDSGALNETLRALKISSDGIDVLTNPNAAWLLSTGISVWKLIGYNGVIFIAAITSISNELYEAAEIDGASRWHKILYIKIPGLLPTIIVLLILNCGWILNSNFEMYYLFSNSFNWDKMEVLDLYIYRYGLQLTNFSYATAVGIMKSVVSISLILIINFASKRTVGKSIL